MVVREESFAGRVGADLLFDTGAGRVAVTICTPRIVRVRVASDNQPRGLSYLPPHDWPLVDFKVHMGETIAVDTGEITVLVHMDPFRITFSDSSGTTLLRELMMGSKRVGASITGVDNSGSPERPQHTMSVPTSRSAGSQVGFEPVGEQHFYGLGEGGKQFDRLGDVRQLWNTHIGHGPGSDVGVPLLLSNKGYGLFFDNSSDAELYVGRSDATTLLLYEAAAGPLDWYYLASSDLRGLMGEVADLLGHAPLPPRWALGYLQSTRHFTDTAQLLQLPRTLREKHIPCDGLIFLSSYGDALGWNRGVGHLEFQSELCPTPLDMLQDIRAQHFHVITHEYPVIHEQSPLFPEAEQHDYLLNEGYDRVTPATKPTTNFREGQRYVDFSHPEARRWWWTHHRFLAELGVEGWWLDGGEGPSSASHLWGGAGLTLHNLYDLLRQQAFAEGEAADYPDRRPFLLCRSGGAGMQRYGATCWSGDINNTFPTLEAQVPLGLNTGLSGIPYWGTDIGGFFHPVPESGELYARWFQFGAFCPIFRSHGWVWDEHVPWAHGPEVEAICRDYAELRYRLLPYTYTLAWQAHTQGIPLMRPLVMNYPDDPRTWELGSEYLWGDDLLVAPVTREGATSWPVYLPAGEWYDFWTDQHYRGPGGVTVDAPLARLPLFVRSGAILPFGPLVEFSDQQPMDELTLLVYPDGDSRSVLYEDDGESNAYHRGAYVLTTFHSSVDRRGIQLRIDEPVGDRSLVPRDRRYLWRVRTDRPQRVTLDGVGELPQLTDGSGKEAGWWLDGDRFVCIQLPSSTPPSTTATLATRAG